jgi:hydroxysqualene synthase
VHGESRATWPANDALCAALQVINHLQDCAKDYRELDRVYIPEDLLAKYGASVQMLGEPTSPPELKRTIREVGRLTMALLDESRPFSSQIRDARLALEVEVIQRLAEDLGRKLLRRDPLCEKVHHTKPEALVRAAGIVGAFALSRAVGRRERARASEAEA